jgi:6-phosphogluconolactonase/glucosamine-6-phosphate isomerase/deaminase
MLVTLDCDFRWGCVKRATYIIIVVAYVLNLYDTCMIIQDNHKQLIRYIADWLVAHSSTNPLLLASGGSAGHAFAEACKKLPTNIQDMYTISLADERYGEVGHSDSNWRLLQDLGVDLSALRHIPVLQGLNMQETATQWGSRIAPFFSPSRTVVTLLGIGLDSHIAGIKPNSPAAHEGEQLTIAYDWDDFSRLTTTPAVFPLLSSAIVFTSGPAKQEVVQLLDSDLDRIAYPSQFIKLVKDYKVYYDSDSN